MADLDDFFKKRDKKKKQGHKSKFATLDTEEFAKQLEATSSVNESSAPGTNLHFLTLKLQFKMKLNQVNW